MLVLVTDTVLGGLTYPLPFRHPAFLGTHHGDDTGDKRETRVKTTTPEPSSGGSLPVKGGAGALVDHLPVPLHLQVRLTVVAAVVLKLINSLHVENTTSSKTSFQSWE